MSQEMISKSQLNSFKTEQSENVTQITPSMMTGKSPVLFMSTEETQICDVVREPDKKEEHEQSEELELMRTQTPSLSQHSKRSEKEHEEREKSREPKSRGEVSEKMKKSGRFGIFLNVSKRTNYSREKSKETIREKDENDGTIRDEKRFLKKIDKYRQKKMQRICVCPLTKFYKWIDFFEHCKTMTHRIRRVCCVACCPPCCCIIHYSAFWPPRCEYYFFVAPEDFEPMRVLETKDVQEMKKRKMSQKKIKIARKADLNVRYNIGMAHMCADDIGRVEGFILKTARKNHIACIYIKCPDGPPRFTMLYSHPNGSDMSDHLIGTPNLLDLARFYHCDVYSYDYTGYGISRGRPSEENMYSDIRAIYEHIISKVEPKNMVLLGYSIGAAATVHLFKQGLDAKQKPAGVILQAPPASIFRVIKYMAGKPGDIEAPSCCMDRFRTCDKIQEVDVPVLIIHGKDDRTVPVEHGKLICRRAVNRVTPEWVPGATHDNIENCFEVWLRIRKFIKSDLKLGGSGHTHTKKKKKTK